MLRDLLYVVNAKSRKGRKFSRILTKIHILIAFISATKSNANVTLGNFCCFTFGWICKQNLLQFTRLSVLIRYVGVSLSAHQLVSQLIFCSFHSICLSTRVDNLFRVIFPRKSIYHDCYGAKYGEGTRVSSRWTLNSRELNQRAPHIPTHTHERETAYFTYESFWLN